MPMTESPWAFLIGAPFAITGQCWSLLFARSFAEQGGLGRYVLGALGREHANKTLWRYMTEALRRLASIEPPRLGSVFGRVLVGDAIHDAVGEGDAIDSLGKTPIVDQVGEPCLTQTARQCVVEILDQSKVE